MSLFRKKCEYCRTKIEKNMEIRRSVKVPGYIGTYPKNFCSKEHADNYERELGERMKNQSNSSGGGCCG